MKVLVIGSKGMLGTDLISELEKEDIDFIGFGREELDITNKKECEDKISFVSPDIIINCAAYTKVDLAEKEREECHKINVEGVENIVSVCKENNIVLIQISTDYVFDGKKKSYDEDDKKNPINHYGKTKSEGEDIITNNLEKYYLIRTSWLFGKNGKNFVETIIKLGKEKNSIKVVDDQIGSPTYTKDLSSGIVNILQNKYKYGVYHLTNSGRCTWFEFAKEIVGLAKIPCKITPCTTEEFPTAAKRPRSTVLNNNKLPKLEPWKNALKEYLEDK